MTVEAPDMTATAVLTAQDRCDRCGAQALLATQHAYIEPETNEPMTGFLLWCNHHFEEHKMHLAVLVSIDERGRLRESAH